VERKGSWTRPSNHRKVSARNESAVGCLLFGGLALIPVGLILTMILYFGAIVRFDATKGTDVSGFVIRGIGPLVILIGIAMAATGLLMGFQFGRRHRAGTGRVEVDPFCRVMARYGFNDEGELLTSDWQFESYDDVTYWVKLQLSSGRVGDFETRREVWEHCADGMVGEGHFDGGWLGMFRPRIGEGPPPNPSPLV
jgi:hypothetical protein